MAIFDWIPQSIKSPVPGYDPRMAAMLPTMMAPGLAPQPDMMRTAAPPANTIAPMYPGAPLQIPQGPNIPPQVPPMGQGAYRVPGVDTPVPPVGAPPQQYPFPVPSDQGQAPQVPMKNLADAIGDDSKVAAAAKKLAGMGLSPPSLEDAALGMAMQGIKPPEQPRVGTPGGASVGGSSGGDFTIPALYARQAAPTGAQRNTSPISGVGALLLGR